jgi:hypothetical protein
MPRRATDRSSDSTAPATGSVERPTATLLLRRWRRGVASRGTDGNWAVGRPTGARSPARQRRIARRPPRSRRSRRRARPASSPIVARGATTTATARRTRTVLRGLRGSETARRPRASRRRRRAVTVSTANRAAARWRSAARPSLQPLQQRLQSRPRPARLQARLGRSPPRHFQGGRLRPGRTRSRPVPRPRR